MIRQMMAVMTLGSFIVFSCSCYSVRPVKPARLSDPDAERIDVLKVEKTSGEIIAFTDKHPGRVLGKDVVGTGTLTAAVEFVEIASADLETITGEEGAYQSVKTRDGKSYGWIKRIVEQGDKAILYVVKAVRNPVPALFKISLSEVERAWAKQLNVAGNLLVLAISVLFVLILATADWSSGHFHYM